MEDEEFSDFLDSLNSPIFSSSIYGDATSDLPSDFFEIPDWIARFLPIITEADLKLIKLITSLKSVSGERRRFYFVLLRHISSVPIGSSRGIADLILEDILPEFIAFDIDQNRDDISAFINHQIYTTTGRYFCREAKRYIVKDELYIDSPLPILEVGTVYSDSFPTDWFTDFGKRIKITRKMFELLVILRKAGKISVQLKKHIVSLFDIVSRTTGDWNISAIHKAASVNLEIAGVSIDFDLSKEILSRFTFPAENSFYWKINFVLFSRASILPVWLKECEEFVNSNDEEIYSVIAVSTKTDYRDKKILFFVVKAVKEKKTWRFSEIFREVKEKMEKVGSFCIEEDVFETITKLRSVRTEGSRSLLNIIGTF